MATIKHKQNSSTGQVPVVSDGVDNELELGEIAINTHDGKMFIRRDQDGTLSLKEIGKADSATNVLYVSTSGADTNDGKTIGDAFLTIDAALAVASEGTTIFVKSGTYTLNNVTRQDAPMGGVVVPKNVSIVGDNLRATKVQGTTSSNDLFYVQNASYITNITFIGMSVSTSKPRQPAAVSFPPVALQPGGVAQSIATSPYVENCTSFNTTATGMLIDGSLTTGLKSMVSDSFTQINAGGTGIHIINRGYAQLVSIFTVSCEHAVLCESGGQCSLTNSNASFGTFGLKATGASESLYAGVVNSNSAAFANNIEITTATPPKYGDAFLVNDRDRQLIAKCSRDTGLIIDAVAQDLALSNNNGTPNFNSIYAGIAYQRAAALPANQVTNTANALVETKRLVRLIDDVIPVKSKTDASFDIVTNIINNGTTIDDDGVATEPGSTLLNSAGTVPALSLPNTLGRSSDFVNAVEQLANNKNFLVAEVTAFLATNHAGHSYNSAKCERDVRYIVDAISYDLMYGGNSATLTAARSYFVGANSQLAGAAQVTATVAAYTNLSTRVSQVIQETTIAPPNQSSVTQDTSGTASSASVGITAAGLVNIIKIMIDDGDLEALPELELPAFPTSGNEGEAKLAIDANRRTLRAGTTDWVAINTGIDQNYYYTVEGVKSSIDFTGTDFNGNPLPTFNPVSGVNAGQDLITITSHGWKTGQPVKYNVTAGGAGVPGLTIGQKYYIKKINDNQFKLSTTADGNTIETISANTGTGSHTLTPEFFYSVSKCSRDTGLIIDAVADDVALETNFNAIYTGIAFQRASAYSTVINTNQKNPTIAAMLDTKRQITQLPEVIASPGATGAITTSAAAINEIIHIFEDGTQSVSAPGDGVADALFLPDTLQRGATYVGAKDELIAGKSTIISNLTNWINQQISGNIAPFTSGFTYDVAKCERDVGFIVDALCYDIMYGTNTATLRAAKSNYVENDAGVLISQLGATAAHTEAAYNQLKLYIAQTITDMGVSLYAGNLVDIIINYIDSSSYTLPADVELDFSNVASGYDSTLTTARTAILSAKSSIQASVSPIIDVYRIDPLEDLRDPFTSGFDVNFKRRSLIAASSMTFEYVGTGTEIQGLTDGGANTDDLYNRPRTDDFPITANEVVFDETTNLGAVYFTSTDHKGDFRIGTEMNINRTAGRIEGDAFNRSLFSVMTPYILAIEGN